MVGRLLSFWEGLFSWAMLVLGRVHVYNIHDVQIPHEYPLPLCWISDMGVVRQLDESAPKIAKRDPCRGAGVVYNAVWLWHPFKPCRCCLTAALDFLFETLLLECCRIIVLFGSPALPFPWQFQHQRFFRHSTKAKVNGQTALFYAAVQVRAKQMRGHGTVLQDKGCVKQAFRRGLFWITLPILASASLAIVSLFTCLSPRVFAWQGTCGDDELLDWEGHGSKLRGQEGQNCVARLFLSWGRGVNV